MSAITGDAFTLISILTRFAMVGVFSFLVFMHAFMSYKVRRIVARVKSDKKGS